VTIRQRTWTRVIVDGEVELEGRVLPGNAYQFTGNDYVEILTGNAAGLQIFYNQRDFGPLGLYGEVIRVVYTLDGIQTPTPTVTPTPTRTLRPSSTPLATATSGN
jgi:cytoskeleton protein RodZ